VIDLVDDHLDRLETALLKGYSLSTAADWILDNTFLKGEHYSYLDHEFQEVIVRDLTKEVIVRKCSQIGLSELSARVALAYCNTMPGFTVIYTLPTAAFAKTFAKTRIDPIIETSPVLAKRVHPEMNSGEVKQFIDSFLYIRGTIGALAAISVPADCLVHDELDFSDEETVSNYESRLTHSKYEMKRKFSTPTVSGRGITAEFDTSKRHWNFAKCCHCNHRFVPDYFLHVRVPGYDGDLRHINAENLWQVRWREAYIECPGCGKEPDLSPEYREWVVENTDHDGDKNGYQVTPFDAPKIITPAKLVQKSTKYKRYADFVNYNLGLPCEDLESSYGEEELRELFTRVDTDPFTAYAYVFGADIGMTCHMVVLALGPNGRVRIVHMEKCPHTEYEKRKGEICAQFRTRVSCMDSQPYYDMLVRMQGRDPNLWGAIFTQTKGLEAIRAVDKQKDNETGQEKVRQASLSRHRVLDLLMSFFRAGNISVELNASTLENKEAFIVHMKDMKRIREFDAADEETFLWKKSSVGKDHFHFALLYAFVASRLIGTYSSSILLPFGVKTFKIEEQKNETTGRMEKPL
jgi:hypothetical protein